MSNQEKLTADLPDNQQRITVGPFPAIAEESDPDTLSIYPLKESTFLEPNDSRRNLCIKLIANDDGSVDVWLPSIGIAGTSHATLGREWVADALYIRGSNHSIENLPHVTIIRDVPIPL